jgi:hypothetical protein
VNTSKDPYFFPDTFNPFASRLLTFPRTFMETLCTIYTNVYVLTFLG